MRGFAAGGPLWLSHNTLAISSALDRPSKSKALSHQSEKPGFGSRTIQIRKELIPGGGIPASPTSAYTKRSQPDGNPATPQQQMPEKRFAARAGRCSMPHGGN